MAQLDNYLNHIQTGESIEEIITPIIVGVGAGYLALFGLMLWVTGKDRKKYRSIQSGRKFGMNMKK